MINALIATRDKPFTGILSTVGVDCQNLYAQVRKIRESKTGYERLGEIWETQHSIGSPRNPQLQEKAPCSIP